MEFLPERLTDYDSTYGTFSTIALEHVIGASIEFDEKAPVRIIF